MTKEHCKKCEHTLDYGICVENACPCICESR